MHERDFNSITVQDILDRAGVGRATFYSHYRNKDDVLYTSYEHLFLYMGKLRDVDPFARQRLVPAEEFLAHVGSAGVFLDSLRVSGKLDDMLTLGVDFVARMIEQRIAPAAGSSPAVPPALVARMLAGAFMEMVKWWLEHRDSSPAQLDTTFHAMARTTLQRASYVQAIPERV